MGPKGRKQLVESWAQYLPQFTHIETINQQVNSPVAQTNGTANQQPHTPDPVVKNVYFHFFMELMVIF